MRTRTRILLLTPIALGLVLAVGHTRRREVVLAYLRWRLDHRHPVAPNRPVPWSSGPATPSFASFEFARMSSALRV